jgi:hypothetical protein
MFFFLKFELILIIGSNNMLTEGARKVYRGRQGARWRRVGQGWSTCPLWALASLHPDVRASFPYLCSLNPHRMPATNFSPYELVPCPTHPYTFPVFFLALFRAILNSCSCILLDRSAVMRTEQFHSLLRRTNGNGDPPFLFPPSSYIIRNYRPTRLVACFHAGILVGLI